MRPATAGLAAAEPARTMLAGVAADVVWRRSARARKVSLRVDARSGAVIVTLPPRASRASGLALLQTHADWLRAHLDKLPGPVVFHDGAELPFCGTLRRVRHAPELRGGAWLEGDDTIVVTGEAMFLPRRLGDFLRAEARSRLGALATAIGRPLGLAPRRISIKDTRTRWGSCTESGVVMFTWRLVMAPPGVQHYVVAHELAHLRHLDHGAEFWALVDRLSPERTVASAWLRAHGAALLRVG